MIRLIALDLDGTLLDPDDRLPTANAAAVRRAQERGLTVVLATSRWYVLACRNAAELSVTAPLICHNGALVKSPVDGEEFLRLEIPPEPASELAAFADAAGYTVMVTVDDVTYVRWEPSIEPKRLYPGMQPAERHAPYVHGGAIAFLVFGREAVRATIDTFADKYGDLLNLARGESETFPPYLNIVHTQADKGRALEVVCGHLGIAADEVMAVGDAGPDVSMLRFAGLAVAMGNAAPEVKAVADKLAPSNTEDGVAWAIDELALSG